MSFHVEILRAMASAGKKPAVEIGDGVFMIEHETPSSPQIVILADRNTPHMRRALEAEAFAGHRELESPWVRAEREAQAQRERLLDAIAEENAFRPLPLPRAPAPKKRAPDWAPRATPEEKRERKKSNKAAKAARRASRGRR